MKWEMAPHSKEYQCINTASINVSRFLFHLLIEMDSQQVVTLPNNSFMLPLFFHSYFAVSRILSTLLPLLCFPSLTASSTIFKFWPKTPLSQILLHSTKVFISLLGLQSIYLLLLSTFHKKKKNSYSTTIMERFPGGGHGNLFQYSCLENPTNREAWQAAVHGAVESDMTEVT